MSLEQGIPQLSSLKENGGWQNWLNSQSASGGLNQLPPLPNQHDSTEFEQYWLIVRCVTFSQINAHGS
jgi:hypothetical protein